VRTTRAGKLVSLAADRRSYRRASRGLANITVTFATSRRLGEPSVRYRLSHRSAAFSKPGRASLPGEVDGLEGVEREVRMRAAFLQVQRRRAVKHADRP
jgi:hypothetical protein